jgi:hypothetical protein
MKRKFFRVIGMQRSGIHAVAEWIRMSHALQGYSVHYDNAVSMEKPNEIAKFLPAKGDLEESFLWMVEHEDVHFIDMPVLSPKLTSNFEYHDILVIRDVFNTMASRRKMNPQLFSRRAVQLWRQYGAEALGNTDYLGPNKTVVLFNKWHQSGLQGQPPEILGYRKQIAAKLGIQEVGAETIKLAVNSSFDPPTTPSNELKLFDRWKNYEDQNFWSAFDSPVYAMNTKLFGEMPEIAKLIK